MHIKGGLFEMQTVGLNPRLIELDFFFFKQGSPADLCVHQNLKALV